MSSPAESSSSSSMAPWLLNACRSFTSLRARQVTGTHLLRIDGYSAAKRMVQRGEFIESRTFSAGGHKWRLRFLPNGYHDSQYYANGYEAYAAGPAPATAVELELMKRSYEDNLALSYTVGPQRFNRASKYKHRLGVLVTPEERQAALHVVEHDDCLTVRCDLTMTRFDKESRLKWYLRKLLD